MFRPNLESFNKLRSGTFPKPFLFSFLINFRSDAQRAAKQKEAKERELEHAAFSADRIEEPGFPPVSLVSHVSLFT